MCLLVMGLGISSVAPSLLLAWGDNHMGALGVGDRRGWVATPLRSLALPHDIHISAVDGAPGGVSVMTSNSNFYSSGHILLAPAATTITNGGPVVSSNAWSVFPQPHLDLNLNLQLETSDKVIRMTSRNCSTMAVTSEGHLFWTRPETSPLDRYLNCGDTDPWLPENALWTLFDLAILDYEDGGVLDAQCNTQNDVCAILLRNGSIYMLGASLDLAGFPVDTETYSYIPFPQQVDQRESGPAMAMSLGTSLMAVITHNGAVWSWGPAVDSEGTGNPIQIDDGFSNATYVACTQTMGWAIRWNDELQVYQVLQWGDFSTDHSVIALEGRLGIEYEIQSVVATSSALHILTTGPGLIFTLADYSYSPPLSGQVFIFNDLVSPNWYDAMPDGYRIRRIFGSASIAALFADAEPLSSPSPSTPLPSVYKHPTSADSRIMAWGQEKCSLGVGVSPQLHDNTLLIGPLEMRFFYNETTQLTSWAPYHSHTALVTSDGALLTFGDYHAAHYVYPQVETQFDWDSPARVTIPFVVIRTTTIEGYTFFQIENGTIYRFGSGPSSPVRSAFARQDDPRGDTVHSYFGRGARASMVQWGEPDFNENVQYFEIQFGPSALSGSQLNITDMIGKVDTVWFKDGHNWWLMSSVDSNASLVYNGSEGFGEPLVVVHTESQLFGVFAYGGENWMELRVIDTAPTPWCDNDEWNCSLANNTLMGNENVLDASSIVQIESCGTGSSQYVLILTDIGKIWTTSALQSLPITVVPFGRDMSNIASRIVRIANQNRVQLFITEDGQLWSTEDDWTLEDTSLTRLFSDYFWLDAPSMPHSLSADMGVRFAIASRTMNEIDPGDYNPSHPYHALVWGDNVGAVLGLGRASMTPGGGFLADQVVLQPTAIPSGHILETLSASNITLLGIATASSDSDGGHGTWGNYRLNPGFQGPLLSYSAPFNDSWYYGPVLRHAVPFGVIAVTSVLDIHFVNLYNSHAEPQAHRRDFTGDIESGNISSIADDVEIGPMSHKRTVSNPRVVAPKFASDSLRWHSLQPDLLNQANCASSIDLANSTLTCASLSPIVPFLSISSLDTVFAVSCLLQTETGTLCAMGFGPDFNECSTGLYGPPENCSIERIDLETSELFFTGWNVIPTDTAQSALYGLHSLRFQLGYRHAIGLATNNTIIGFGSNDKCQLGGSPPWIGYPQAINTSHLPSIQWWKVVAGGFSSYAVALPNTIYAWGDNVWGQLGAPSTVAPPSCELVKVATPAIPVGIGIRDFACSAFNCFLAYEHGEVYTWGAEQFGLLARPLGPDEVGSSLLPAIIPTLPYLRPGFIVDHFITSPTANSIIARGANNDIPPYIPLPSGSCIGNPPTIDFVCIGGIWRFYGSITIGGDPNGPSTITITGPTTIIGNFSVLAGGTLVFSPSSLESGQYPLLDVSGCFQTQAPLEVVFGEEIWETEKKNLKGKTLYLLETGQCSNPNGINSVAVKSPKDCRKVTSTVQSQDKGNSRTGFNVLFNVKNNCNTWWIVLISVLAAVGIASLIAGLAWRHWRASKLDSTLPSSGK